MNYRVAWDIDLDADSPEEAAKLALEIQQDPDSTARVFVVEDIEGKSEIVDLAPQFML